MQIAQRLARLLGLRGIEVRVDRERLHERSGGRPALTDGQLHDARVRRRQEEESAQERHVDGVGDTSRATAVEYEAQRDVYDVCLERTARGEGDGLREIDRDDIR